VLSVAGAAFAAVLLQTAVPAFDRIPAETRNAFARQDFRTLFEESPGVLLQLPGEPMNPRLRAVAAGAVLRAYLRRARTLNLAVESARVVAERSGYVELARRYRRPGVTEDRRERILVSLRVVNGTWRVTEVLVLE
jgi:hypothetical protein